MCHFIECSTQIDVTCRSFSLQLNDNQRYLNDALARLIILKTDYTKEWYDNNWYCTYNDGLVRYLMMSIALVRLLLSQ